ncbi:hypothetical protein B0H21DRAFT_689815 [Amylocystis lapponica]|nr:hypothetical protein B0H21DRAFT_689815 [Amylocystis lapponica]
MSGRCGECGESTTWDQELGSSICTHCGTLVDPTQSVLASHIESTDVSGRENPFWYNVRGNTLKGRNGWALAGQGKEARDRHNTIAMHEFLRSIAARLSHPGSVGRAHGLFDQAMSRGHYRWGRRAKLVAGASLAIALRESHKSDSIRDIAYLLDEPPVSLSRMFTTVVSLLQLNLASADPTVHLPALRSHLMTLLEDSSSSTIPAKLRTVLMPFRPRFPAIIRTASSLSVLLSRTDTLAQLPTPPTACALLMLSLEAELLDSLPHAGVLAQVLGGRVGVSKTSVMQRYKIIYDLVEEWIKELPWLNAHERKKGGAGRSKVAKRVVVARGLKDVVQFQEEIWRKRFEGQARPALELELDSELGDNDDIGSEAGTSTGSSSVAQEEVDDVLPSKKRKTRHDRSIAQASHFLLRPLSGTSSPRLASDREGGPDLLTHLLTADTSDLTHVFARAPSRLQLLAASRGGADEEDIADDELFAEGELEGMFRSTEEACALRQTMDWDSGSDEDAADGNGSKHKKQKTGGAGGDDVRLIGESKGNGTRKINMDALAKLLDPSVTLDYNDDAFGDGREEGAPAEFLDGEVVEDWRPPSPGGGGFDEDRYNW